MNTSRFCSASASLHLGMLLKQAQKALWSAMILAVAVHALLSQMGSRQAVQQTAKPLTTQFVKRQPRLTKPLELKKRPRPKRQMMRRQMVSIKANVNREGISSDMRSVHLLQGLSRPDVRIERSVALDAAVSIPEVAAAAIGGSRDFDQRIDTSLEMLDIEALDTGKYHAMVIVDPGDKQNIRGFFHLAIAYSVNAADVRLGAHYFERPTAIPNLVRAVNSYTDIKMDISGSYPYDSRELFKIPFVYSSVSSGIAHSFRITDSEARNLGSYLLAGGLLMMDDSHPDLYGPSDFDARKTLKDALGAVGWAYQKDWDFEKIPRSYPLYHCYFDFNGPPMAGDCLMVTDPSRGSPRDYLEGIFREGRLIAIMSNKDYEDIWSYHSPDRFTLAIRAYQFGVNIIVFALTQEGSITRRVMDTVK